jgi:hypothetical protein
MTFLIGHLNPAERHFGTCLGLDPATCRCAWWQQWGWMYRASR